MVERMTVNHEVPSSSLGWGAILLCRTGWFRISEISVVTRIKWFFYDKLDERMTKFMIEHTDMTADFIEEIKDREYYMFSEEAKERHIVDKIIGIDCDIDEII